MTPSRLKASLFLCFHLFLLVFLVVWFRNAIFMFMDDFQTDTIPSAELQYLREEIHLASKNMSLDNLKAAEWLPNVSGHEPLIPKIIHQTWKTDTVPEKWKAAQESCLALHPDYKYILWTDEMSRNFIAEHYPWFLKYFDAYPYNVQRADAIRYFVLLHYGGIYIDLDDGCQRRLDSLLYYPAVFRRTDPVGVSNDVMGSVPGHPFFSFIISKLASNAKSYIFPYPTIMFSTGPLSISFLWENYKNHLPKDSSASARIRIMLEEDYKLSNESYFTYFEGSSWHEKDASFILWANKHILGLIVFGFSTYFVLSYFVFSKFLDSRLCERCFFSRQHKVTLPLSEQEDV
ncbi:mannosyltransferase [Schizosaccharomyces cryophilus OY26]|uniref:Mannosyltransferase n=1 Tax=Schizosaccharomyces cryophilus (strain OY26 / ATCC MYA-4695 / CBS 11777 / NBRC 106824 / NRRL Y48691) TaxID=653667 RepID=S9VZI5_SCHCR|nr:mannosyltransferase [Schizosaccharomyces cryophilus OY26]EPY51215.1 mannosyltransferase [Schizosaccharomyces cryophilus OY26]